MFINKMSELTWGQGNLNFLEMWCLNCPLKNAIYIKMRMSRKRTFQRKSSKSKSPVMRGSEWKKPVWLECREQEAGCTRWGQGLAWAGWDRKPLASFKQGGWDVIIIFSFWEENWLQGRNGLERRWNRGGRSMSKLSQKLWPFGLEQCSREDERKIAFKKI